MKHTTEILRVSTQLGIDCLELTEEHSRAYIQSVVEKFQPQRLTGHLAIHHDSVSVPLEPYEFTYSEHLPDEPIYLFFEQEGASANEVVVISNGRQLNSLLEECYGMEYFISNQAQDYLLAVNWYVIEGTGTAVNWLEKLIGHSDA